MSSRSWEEIGAAKRKEVSDSIPEEWRIPPRVFPPETQLDVANFPVESGLFTTEELEITAAYAEDILENVRTSKWTAVQVAQSFCKRAAVAHQLVGILGCTDNVLVSCESGLLMSTRSIHRQTA